MKLSPYSLFLFSMFLGIFIVGCTQQEFADAERLSENAGKSRLEVKEVVDSRVEGLGKLCLSQAMCETFCHSNKGRCKDYCNNYPENTVCQKLGFAKNTCVGSVKFDHAPVNLDKIELMLPLGIMVGGHVLPTDHHYFQNFFNDMPNIEVYSPGRGTVTSISHMPGAKKGEDYRVVVEHSCSVSSIFIHITHLSEKLMKYASPENGHVGVSIPVEGGETIGYFANNVDYNIADTAITLPGLLVPQHYEPETWKVHTANTYDYFNEPVRSRLIEKSLRTAEPISGKIDYDIEGKLSGNWFQKDSGGYYGTEKYAYWQGHLAFAYDYLDSERIVISIAGYDEQPSRQFAVKGNSPKPSEVDVGDGVIKYELVGYDYITPAGTPWDRKSLVKGLKSDSNDIVQGIVLARILNDREIMFEAFPGKTASQVTGFTSNARIYGR